MSASVADNGCRCLTWPKGNARKCTEGQGESVSATSEDAKTDRLTLRLPSRELEQLRELARERHTEVATLVREAIRAYLDGPPNPHEELQRLAHGLREAIHTQADRVIERHEKTTRALIAALNEHLTGKR